MTDPAAPSAAVEPDPRVLAWRALADDLTPAKSLARIDVATSRVVTNVTVVGSLLTGLGLLAAGQPATDVAARRLAVAGVVAAVLAVACALTAQTVSIRSGLNTNNLVMVKEWYRTQFRRRAYPARAATVLLLVAVVLAGGAAVVALTAPDGTRLSLGVSAIRLAGSTASDGATVTAEVAFRSPDPDAGATVTVTADGGGGPVMLAHAALTPAVEGTASRTLTVSGVPEGATVDVTAVGGGRQCRATWETSDDDRPVVTCGPAEG
ncbi:hypothetical protein FHU33_2321 [Blastococcus colisei]|uniref:Uncharacterized protein n=1 Tax=Blastococcus colisei TaxID=1564162 RepID=A0A543PFR8_9ACTN|nr:hypothetical protein [Blastococcus colisei]TQN42910.1 hypothetical protein FHU33_2321 [Blastococcus colisei]